MAWTSAQILRDSDRFTLLSASTLLDAEVVHVAHRRAAHVRLFTADRPQPPAADCSVALEQVAFGTVVTAHFSIEPWFLEQLDAHVQMGEHTPVSLFLRALESAVVRRA